MASRLSLLSQKCGDYPRFFHSPVFCIQPVGKSYSVSLVFLNWSHFPTLFPLPLFRPTSFLVLKTVAVSVILVSVSLPTYYVVVPPSLLYSFVYKTYKEWNHNSPSANLSVVESALYSLLWFCSVRLFGLCFKGRLGHPNSEWNLEESKGSKSLFCHFPKATKPTILSMERLDCMIVLKTFPKLCTSSLNLHFTALLVLLREASSNRTDSQPVWEQVKQKENFQKNSCHCQFYYFLVFLLKFSSC